MHHSSKQSVLQPTSYAVLLALILLPVSATGAASAKTYDLVINNGQVINPETELNAVRDIGIKNGKIVKISKHALTGEQQINATGLVVAPGFIDIHSHAINTPSMWMQAFDGVTTTLELERGAWPVGEAYAKSANRNLPLNYGYSVSWADIRMSMFGDDFGKRVKPGISNKILKKVEQGLYEGGIGIGLLPGYMPKSNHVEYLKLARLAAKYDVPTFTHVRWKYNNEPGHAIEGYEEVIAAAAMTGAHMHICHLTSSATHSLPEIAGMIKTAQSQGVPISTETYPYGAGSTIISAAFLDPDNLSRLGIKSSDIVYLKTGERPKTNERLKEIQKADPEGLSIVHYLDPEKPQQAALIDQAVRFTDGIIASDAQPYTIDGKELEKAIWPIPEKAVTHPRSVATFARVMGHYVRDLHVLTLSEAIKKATLLPAKLLENTAPGMRHKGRISEGSDADIVIFDARRIKDQASYENPRKPSIGVKYLLVDGKELIENGVLNQKVRAGEAIRGQRHS